jgi:DNA polymerase III alpha subunit (gram-positive type)
MSLKDWTRPIVVVDTETTGLDFAKDFAVEVAWWNLMTDERGSFVPIHDVARVLSPENVPALRVNRYIDRLADEPQDTEFVELNRLHDQLERATLAGSNPAFDAVFLARMFEEGGRLRLRPWHHRMLDLAAYAAGALDIPEIPGLSTVCGELHIDQPDHSAEGDVTATGRCLLALINRTVNR